MSSAHHSRHARGQRSWPAEAEAGSAHRAGRAEPSGRGPSRSTARLGLVATRPPRLCGLLSFKCRSPEASAAETWSRRPRQANPRQGPAWGRSRCSGQRSSCDCGCRAPFDTHKWSDPRQPGNFHREVGQALRQRLGADGWRYLNIGLTPPQVQFLLDGARRLTFLRSQLCLIPSQFFLVSSAPSSPYSSYR